MASATMKKAVKSPSKTEIISSVAEATGLPKKDVANVIDNLCDVAFKALGDPSLGMFKLPGLVQLKRVHKPATPEREGRNPGTGEPMIFKAKPARIVVKAFALKAAKDAAS